MEVDYKVLKEKIELGINKFNRYRSPEAIAKLVNVRSNEIRVKISGPFCISCGLYDYFDDLRIELKESIGSNLEIRDVKEETKDSFLVCFILK